MYVKNAISLLIIRVNERDLRYNGTKLYAKNNITTMTIAVWTVQHRMPFGIVTGKAVAL